VDISHRVGKDAPITARQGALRWVKIGRNLVCGRRLPIALTQATIGAAQMVTRRPIPAAAVDHDIRAELTCASPVQRRALAGDRGRRRANFYSTSSTFGDGSVSVPRHLQPLVGLTPLVLIDHILKRPSTQSTEPSH
jgi:hypothetical protein